MICGRLQTQVKTDRQPAAPPPTRVKEPPERSTWAVERSESPLPEKRFDLTSPPPAEKKMSRAKRVMLVIAGAIALYLFCYMMLNRM